MAAYDDELVPSPSILSQSDHGFDLVSEAPDSVVDLHDSGVNIAPVASTGNTGSASSSALGEVVNRSEWNNMLAHSFSSAFNIADVLPLPWETGIMKDIFSREPNLPSVASAYGDHTNFAALYPNVSQSVLDISSMHTEEGVQPAYLSAVKSMKDMDYISEKKAKLSLAVGKWLDILSIDWKGSAVGVQLEMDLQSDPSGSAAEQTLVSVFGVKSPTTLLKRAASFKQYVVWHHKACIESDMYVGAIPLSEVAVWNYFQHLKFQRVENKRGFTVSSTFLETVRFCKFVFGMTSADEVLDSKRLLGFSAIEKKEKGPLSQAPPLELEHLVKLHDILEHGSNDVDRMGAGAFLCCIYARARWSDVRHIHHIKYDGFKRNTTMDLYTAEHKTSSAGLRREQFLPLVIPAEGVCEGDWIGTFIGLTEKHGYNWEQVPFGPLLPAPKSTGGWCARPLSTAEAAQWLRKLLSGCSNCDSIRAHSMKVTLCVWTARAGFSKEHRATLSHHSSALRGSDIVYSRELQTSAIRKLQMLLKKIRIGLMPDSGQQGICRDLTSTFDAGQTSAVRTPVLVQGQPATPLPAASTPMPEVLRSGLESGTSPLKGPPNLADGDAEEEHSFPIFKRFLAEQENQFDEIKYELDQTELCEKEADQVSLMGAEVAQAGLIELDSSSGSDSSSTSSSSEDESDEEAFANSKPAPAYTETVPVGIDFHVHKKSKIMHRAKAGRQVFDCKGKLHENYFAAPRLLNFKYPKCLKCFPHDGNRVVSRDDAIRQLDDALARNQENKKARKMFA